MNHYRVIDTVSETGEVEIRVQVFYIHKETPKGYWVSPYQSFPSTFLRNYLRWVSKTSLKRYCYPTLEEAMNSFRRRKQVQESKLRWQYLCAKRALVKFAQYKDLPLEAFAQGVRLGYPE